MSDTIESVLKLDAKTRLLSAKGIALRESDIYPISSLVPQTWDYSYPTFYTKLAIPVVCTVSEIIIERFYDAYPSLKNVCMDNILIAGGSVARCIVGNTHYSDVDLFIFGLPEDQLNSRVEKLFTDIFGALEAVNVDVIRSQFAITIRLKYQRPIQIVLRSYSTPSEVLHGFDLGSSAVGILGDQVITTGYGKFCFERMINILNLPRRSLTYESRLIKYCHMGFRLVLPDFVNPNNHEYIKLNCLEINCTMVLFNKYQISQCKFKNSEKGYSTELNDLTRDSITKLNIERLARWCPGNTKKPSLIYFMKCYSVREMIETMSDMTIAYPRITPVVIGDTKTKICNLNTFYNEITLYNGVQIDTANFKRYLPYCPITDIADIILELSPTDRDAYFRLLRLQHIERVKEHLEIYNRDNGGQKIQWILKNPGCQLVGLSELTAIGKANWYGEYYKN